MGKWKEIDGKVFGERLFDPFVETYPSEKILAKVTLLRKNRDFIKRWKALWTWRNLDTQEEIIRFFRVHAFIRNPQVKSKMAEFYERKDMIGFDEYISRNWFMNPGDLLLCENSLSGDFAKSTKKMFEKAFQIMTSDSAIKEINSAIPFQAKEIKRYDEYPVQKSGVIELFDEKEYMGSYDDEGYIQKEIDERQESVFDHASVKWQQDLNIIETDRYYRQPTIYFRVDLNKYNTETLNKIKALIETKIKKIRCRPQNYIIENSLELALMIYDLDKEKLVDKEKNKELKFTDEEIGELMECDVEFIKKKLKLGRQIVNNSITREPIFHYKDR